MTQYNALNKKLFNFQIIKLKSGIKNKTEMNLKISFNVIGDSNDKNNFPNKLLITNTQVSRLCKTFANNLSADIKLSKPQLLKIGQSGGLLGRPLEPLLKSEFLLIGNLVKPLAKSILLGTLGAILLGNLLTGKGAITASQEREPIGAGDGTIRAD